MQRFYASSLARHASRIMGLVSEIKLPAPVLNPLIQAYSRAMGVSMDEVAKPDGGFDCFGDFFARRLKPEARPISREQGAVVSPCDGLITALGMVEADGSFSLEVKQDRYDLDALVGESGCKNGFDGGGYLIVYLHPRDYHRVHVPADGVLTRMRHIPGARYPVTDRYKDRVSCLLGKNERVVFHLRLENGAQLILIMVAAFGVGNIETALAPKSWTRTRASRERDFDPPLETSIGLDLGAFRLGSTVVMIWSRGAVELRSDVRAGRISMGQPIGKVRFMAS